MISLVLHGKIPESEDALTAAFFDAFRYTRDAKLLGRILSHAKLFEGSDALPAFDDFEVELWPSLGGKEPDAWLYLYARGKTVCRVIVEAKLGADKSSFGAIDRDARSGDQLAYYFLEAVRIGAEHPCALLYLTHHGAMPRESLRESTRVLAQHSRGESVGRFFWLSWRDVHEVLVEEHARSVSGPLADVCRLLERVRMFRFRSIRVEEQLGALGSPDFYAEPFRDPTRADWRQSPDRALSSPEYLGGFYEWPTAPQLVGTADFYKESR